MFTEIVGELRTVTTIKQNGANNYRRDNLVRRNMGSLLLYMKYSFADDVLLDIM
ncbi:hypothetical protein [Bacillus thuringiensis]|uniref:hypothetical protein n=1 Tax=Bacillus thuringiensis TaxID=1428 RepID=UPI0037D2F0C2